jgi:hypothetical protein
VRSTGPADQHLVDLEGRRNRHAGWSAQVRGGCGQMPSREPRAPLTRLPQVNDVVKGNEGVRASGEQPHSPCPVSSTRDQLAVVDTRAVPQRKTDTVALERSQLSDSIPVHAPALLELTRNGWSRQRATVRQSNHTIRTTTLNFLSTLPNGPPVEEGQLKEPVTLHAVVGLGPPLNISAAWAGQPVGVTCTASFFRTSGQPGQG